MLIGVEAEQNDLIRIIMPLHIYFFFVVNVLNVGYLFAGKKQVKVVKVLEISK
jgi:hypothetical protein